MKQKRECFILSNKEDRYKLIAKFSISGKIYRYQMESDLFFVKRDAGDFYTNFRALNWCKKHGRIIKDEV